MPLSFMGLGTTYYGQRAFRSDGTYLTTLWVIVLWLPVFPIWSFRVRDFGPEGKDSFYDDYADRYEVVARERISAAQWVSVWGYLFGYLVLTETAFGPFQYPSGRMLEPLWEFVSTMFTVILAALSSLRFEFVSPWVARGLLLLWLFVPTALRRRTMAKAGYRPPVERKPLARRWKARLRRSLMPRRLKSKRELP
jgi:hypothetical protein